MLFSAGKAGGFEGVTDPYAICRRYTYERDSFTCKSKILLLLGLRPYETTVDPDHQIATGSPIDRQSPASVLL